MTREEAIHEIKQWDFINNDEMEALRTLIPELRESEDERIKKELIEFIKWSVDRHFMREDFHQAKRPSEWIAYLEKKKEYHIPWYDYQKSKEAGYTIVPNEEYEQLIKQKEQKPAEWNNTDMKEERDNLISVCRDWEHGKKTTLLPIAAVRARYFLEHLTEPKSAEWSEEDEKMRYFVTEAVQSRYSDRELAKYLDPKIINEKKRLKQKLFDWLRDLRPHWKPSKEQMEALKKVTGNAIDADEYYPALATLYYELKEQF